MARGSNGSPGEILAKDMGGQADHTHQTRSDTATGVNQGNGAAIGMADEKMIPNAGLLNDIGQYHHGLMVHEIYRTRQRARIGTTVSQATVNQGSAAGEFNQPGRKIAPQIHTTQPFVKEYQGRGFIRSGPDPDRFQPSAAGTYMKVESTLSVYF